MSSNLALSPMRSLSRANEALARMQARVKSVQTKAEEMTGHVVQSAEVSGAAFALGLVRGKYGVRGSDGLWHTPEVLGVPLELAVGVGLNLAAHAKVAGASSEHLHNFGDGALAVYFATLGDGVGRQMGLPAGAPPAP